MYFDSILLSSFKSSNLLERRQSVKGKIEEGIHPQLSVNNVVQYRGRSFDGKIMPVKVDITPPPPANSKQPGVTKSLLYNGSKFQGHQKSKGNSYEVEVVLQVSNKNKVSTQYC